jgi:hypothetical protein
VADACVTVSSVLLLLNFPSRVYTALLIKVFAYLLALRLKAQGVFSKLTLTAIMRQLRREADLRDFLTTHFHAPFSIG